MKDLFGQALLDFQKGKFTEDIITSTNISEDDILPISYLFRDFKDMPKLEQKAIKLVKGSILDVGCGAGSHSLYLQKNNFRINSSICPFKTSEELFQKKKVDSNKPA